MGAHYEKAIMFSFLILKKHWFPVVNAERQLPLKVVCNEKRGRLGSKLLLEHSF